MRFGKRYKQYLSFFYLVIFFVVTSQSAHADWYISGGATVMDVTLGFGDGDEKYDLTTGIARIGNMHGVVGWELQIIGGAEDQVIDINGNEFELQLNLATGIYIVAADENRNFYIRIGANRFDTEYFPTATPSIRDDDKILVWGIGGGAKYDLSEDFRIFLDYTYYEGKFDYPTFTISIPGGTNPTFKINALALGLSYSF